MRLIFLLWWFSLSALATPLKVTLVNPSIPGTPFWDRVTAIAYAAANDLNIELSVVYGRDNRIFNHKTIEQLAFLEQKPDYVVLMPYGGNAKVSFDVLEKAKVSFITMERTLHYDEQTVVGFPQENYQYWLGEVYHDNTHAGLLLANTLITKASHLLDKDSLTAIGISGSFSGESEQRVGGFIKSLSQYPDVELLQVVPGGWSRERSRDIIHQLASRYGEIDIAWTASDGMALGVLDSASSLHSPIKNRIITGGIDWTSEAVQKIKSGQMTASVGGHIMQAAWALIKIHDHHGGQPVFIKGDGTPPYYLEVITADNIDSYDFLAQQVDWSLVDFKKFSLLHPPKKTAHRFKFSLVVEQINAITEQKR
ncbi:ABC transporter substrate-binding protein [Thalassotalea fusca]